MTRDNYIQIRVSSEQKANIKANASRNNQTVTDYIMAAIMEFEKMNLGLYGSPYGYGCPYQFARDYLVQSIQVIELAVEVLEERIKELKAVKSE